MTSTTSKTFTPEEIARVRDRQRAAAREAEANPRVNLYRDHRNAMKTLASRAGSLPAEYASFTKRDMVHVQPLGTYCEADLDALEIAIAEGRRLIAEMRAEKPTPQEVST
jgi:hypothetical protein